MKRFILAAIAAAFLGSFAALAATEATGSFSNSPAAAKADRAFGDDTTSPDWGTGTWNSPNGSWSTDLDLTFTNSANVEREGIVIKATQAQWRRWNRRYGAGFGETEGMRRVPGRILARGTVAPGASEPWAKRISNRGGPVVVIMSRDEMTTGGSGWGFGSGRGGNWSFVTGGRFPEGRGGVVTDTIDISGVPAGAWVDVDHSFTGISFGRALVTYEGGGTQTANLGPDGRFRLDRPGVAFNLRLEVSSSTVPGVVSGSVFSFQTDGPDADTTVGPNDPLTVFPGVALGETFRVDASTQ